jgi:hypothetical protein
MWQAVHVRFLRFINIKREIARSTKKSNGEHDATVFVYSQQPLYEA